MDNWVSIIVAWRAGGWNIVIPLSIPKNVDSKTFSALGRGAQVVFVYNKWWPAGKNGASAEERWFSNRPRNGRTVTGA
jgi:hypothetical protein